MTLFLDSFLFWSINITKIVVESKVLLSRRPLCHFLDGDVSFEDKKKCSKTTQKEYKRIRMVRSHKRDGWRNRMEFLWQTLLSHKTSLPRSLYSKGNKNEEDTESLCLSNDTTTTSCFYFKTSKGMRVSSRIRRLALESRRKTIAFWRCFPFHSLLLPLQNCKDCSSCLLFLFLMHSSLFLSTFGNCASRVEVILTFFMYTIMSDTTLEMWILSWLTTFSSLFTLSFLGIYHSSGTILA